MRHGSASTGTLDEIMKRGRWQTNGSVRRYINGGRLPEVFARLSGGQREHCLQVESEIGGILQGSKPPVKPSLSS